MIKAIQTSYKGYRFRSRLEARWAVFFDTLGIEWEYEKEGFELGDEGRYLPDFWLPGKKVWVEIKPDNVDISPTELKVFCAGKVGTCNHREDWRYQLLDDRQDFFFDTRLQYTRNPSDFTLDMIDGCKYVGPFSFDDLGGHGFGNPKPYGDHGVGIPQFVVQDCQQRITSCDVVFAWITSNDCYGTLVELGYASAFGKKIWIGVPSTPSEDGEDGDGYDSELWYAFACADRLCTASSALEAFTSLNNRRFPDAQRKIMALSEQSGHASVMLCGQPWPGEHKMYVFGKGKVSPMLEFDQRAAIIFSGDGDVDKAFRAARSARFEHGESPK